MATFRDRLAHLNLNKAAKLLGPRGKTYIMRGGKTIQNISPEAELKRDVLRVVLPDARVSIVDDPLSVGKMRLLCDSCDGACTHKGAALSLVLEEKTALGLASPPPDEEDPGALTEEELVERELARRADRAQKERMRVRSSEPRRLWTDYTVQSSESGKTYRVALRGLDRGESYCTCPDFRKNTLGTCKHIIRVISSTKRKFSASQLSQPWKPDHLAVYVRYESDAQLRLQIPETIDRGTRTRFKDFIDREITDVSGLVKAISRHIAKGDDIVVYPDAEQLIQLKLHEERIKDLTEDMRGDSANHPLRRELLKTELMPYQLEGIAFCVGAGRAVLADDMGLGKTIQAIGSAELLARECGIRKVLVICPASVKSQWRDEIKRFSGRSVQIVAGPSSERQDLYFGEEFFTICNYEQVLRDLTYIEETRWDLIILDEGQRIKNWEAKTSKTVKCLRSLYAIVLSGTPLENRLEELYSVIEFIDDRRLGPDFRFHHEHRLTDERGRIVGYDNLDVLREKISPLLLRRTRKQILKQLPPRTNQVIRIPATEEQLGLHGAQMRIVNMIARKPYISEFDLLRLQKALLAARMVADSTFLVDKQPPGYSTKLEQLAELLPRIAAEEDRKAIVFSEWTTMLGLIEDILRKHNFGYVRLDGSVPQTKRAALIQQFNTDPSCRFFLATNAGATGLNLQAADTVVNVDLPWNPAVLEQRIGRAHRMGQMRPVHVYLLVTEETIEENMLGTLALKHNLAMAALDVGSEVTRIDMASGMDELKKRLEVLLGQKPVEEDRSEYNRVEREATEMHATRREKVEVAGGTLLTAAFSMLEALLPETEKNEKTTRIANQIRAAFEECVESEKDGSLSLKVKLKNKDSLDSLCSAVAGLVSAAEGS